MSVSAGGQSGLPASSRDATEEASDEFYTGDISGTISEQKVPIFDGIICPMGIGGLDMYR